MITIIVEGDAQIHFHLPQEAVLSEEDTDILDKTIRDTRKIARRLAKLDAETPNTPQQPKT